MTRTSDPLSRPVPPDRLHYETGMLLDVEDFQDEQTYHRSRLARLAAYLHGYGTVAGLEVRWLPALDEETSRTAREEQLVVTAGLALDRLGRLIEVRRSQCLRLGVWFEQHAEDSVGRDRLSKAYHSASFGFPDGVWADVFLAYTPCLHGTRPAFATGTLDKMDGVAPSRIRDGSRLSLVLREETHPPTPRRSFPDLSGLTDPEERQRRVMDYKLREAWLEASLWQEGGDRLSRLPEHTPDQDGTELFLARIVLPASPGPPVVRDMTRDVEVFNHLRLFSFSTTELAWLAGHTR